MLLRHRSATYVVWSQTGNQGNKWRRGEVFLGLLNDIQVCQLLSHLERLYDVLNNLNEFLKMLTSASDFVKVC